ncbi:glycosyltransferase [uncultured Flavobacterium sp.]|uniref:glycosyltransferase family 2 protein n=1 Tax=uncultured Flavobacterium sp. TaxID=165435 RepID=UPI0030EECC4A
MTKVSIIIPSYNHSRFLMDRLESISNQTFTQWEAIIIDDKSSDDSVNVIKKFIEKNPEFKVKYFIINKSNSGSGYNSWKKGIELAETEYIWIAETDDYSDIYFLEEQINALENNENSNLSFCTSEYVSEHKINLYDSANRTKDLAVEENKIGVFSADVFMKKMPFHSYITNGSSVVFRKPKIEILGEIFNNRLCSDIFLWSFLVQNSSFVFINKKLNFFRRHEGSTSSHLQNHKLESVYHELAKYLNYFNQTKKEVEFLEHYIKHYIWAHKKDFLNTSSLQKLQSNKMLKRLYFYKLTKYAISKLTKR